MSRKHTILVVDDESFVRDSLVDLLENEGYRAAAAASAEEAVEALRTRTIHAVVTDLSMPAENGLSLLKQVRQVGSEIPVILLTGVGTITDAVAAMKAGAFDFIQKPVDPGQFILLIHRAIEHQDLVSEVRYLRHAVRDLRGPMEMIGASPALKQVRSLIEQVAPSDVTVLITGESGSGKELIAGEIHRLGRRASRNLVRVNCAAVSESLFESEFFGHRRGSFTGAVSDREGRFAEAEGGTLVLDEIGTLRPEMQAKLLRVLETGEYQAVGESRTRSADVRVMAVTNEDLARRSREGTFRADLFYRLNVFPIHVPPLRERREDIPLLADYFLGRARPSGTGSGKGPARSQLSPEAIEVLCGYGWPGNIRELRNIMERAVILSGNAVPDAALLRSILGPGAPAEPAGSTGDLALRPRLDALERRLLSEALERSGGRKRPAAELLGIDPKNLGYYLKKHRFLEEGAEESSAPEP